MSRPRTGLTDAKRKERKNYLNRLRRQERLSDPDLVKEDRLKARQRYLKRKAEGKLKSIKDKSKKEQLEQRRKWRKNTAAYRMKMMYQDDTPPSTPQPIISPEVPEFMRKLSERIQDSTAAKRMRTYRERMKSDPNKFELLRKKENEWHRASRKKLSEERTSEKDIIARRIAWAERKRRQRQKKQLNAAPTQGEQRITEQSSDGDFSESLSNSTAKEPPIKKQKESDPVERQNELLKMACDLLSSNCKQEETNECLDIAKVWGTKLMSLDPMQRRFAEKAINDVLFEADMGTLHRDSVQINSNISHNPLAIP